MTKLVFGDQLMYAKCHFAENLSNKKILIIGGGDGLDYQDFQNQLSGEYWEISKAMLKKAEINLAKSALTFHLDFFQAQKGKLFDEVWLHFLLDTMKDDEIGDLLQEIKKSMSPEGRIFLVDFFAPVSAYQKFLHQCMITFFRLVTNHKRASIPDYEVILLNQEWVKISEKEFLKGWVKAQVWEKLGS
jgi:SAM-dependent methyltransferase